VEALSFELPYPPSHNSYYRRVGHRTLISREGRAYRKRVIAQLMVSGGGQQPPNDGRIALAMDAFPPDRRRRDLDNIQKPLLDALEHAGVYADDSQIDLLLTARQSVEPGGKVCVRVVPFPLNTCPICHNLLPKGAFRSCTLN
jgi:crossover junction endodeoxyribonuclease RusA